MLGKNSKKSDSYISEMPFHAYEGNEPYIFVSYAHADAHLVFPEIKRLHDEGLNVWYDQGIAPGNEWTEEIGNALEGCSLFIVFISKNSANSVNVRNEINFALQENKPFFSIYLEETDLPSGLKLSMGSLQSILKYAMNDDEFVFRRNKALKQNGFDITSGTSVKYDVKQAPTTPKKSGNKLPYVAIGVIAIIAIIAVVLFALPSTTNTSTGDSAIVSDSNLTLTITDAYIGDTGYCDIYGKFNYLPENLEGLSVKVEYFDSSGNLINSTVSDGIDPYSNISDSYKLSEQPANDKSISQIKVYILDNDNQLCSDEYKLKFNNVE